MTEINALETARIVVEEYGNQAEREVNRRAEMALAQGDLDSFEVWSEVIVFVSDIQERQAGARPA